MSVQIERQKKLRAVIQLLSEALVQNGIDWSAVTDKKIIEAQNLVVELLAERCHD